MSNNEPMLRVLLIEDDEDDFLITRDLLVEHSPVETRLDWVETVPEGLKALAETDYDAALVDLRLGPDTGLDLIREAGEQGINTPFILLTGQGDEELDQRAVEFGAADYLVKNNLDGPTLIRSIRYAIDRAIATENLASSEAHYRILFENNPVPMCLVDQNNDQIHSMNQAARALYGYDQDEVGQLTLTNLLDEDEKDRSIPSEGILLHPDTTLQRHRNKGGEVLIVEITSRQVAINHHQLQLLMLNDVSDLLEKSRELRLLRRSIESSSTGVLISDAQQQDMPLIYANPAFEKITGYSANEALGRNCRFLQGDEFDLTNEQSLDEIRKALRKGTEVSVVLRNFRKDGTPFWNDLYLAPVRDDQGNITHYTGIMSDISEKKSTEHELAYNISHDVLTGLPNRTLLEDRLHQACRLASRYNRVTALLFVDLDGFKLVNDSLGHRVGDQLLREVAIRLQSQLRSGDTVARISGDEFVVVLPDLARAADANLVAEAILSDIARPYRVGDLEDTLHLTASVGIASTDMSLDNPMELLQQADLAMFQAKQLGRNTYQWYSRELNAQAELQMTLRNDLQNAITNGDLALYYQPIINARTGAANNIEALSRWHHPVKGLISPADFIPLAEQTGQIIELGKWALETACRETVQLHARGFRNCTVAVNVSPVQLRKAGFRDTVEQVLKSTGLPPGNLELEIVESAVLYDADLVVGTLNAVREMGVKVSIDDFGTGFSSLSYIKLLPADKIKIDRSFITDVIKNRSDAAITQGVISMGHHLSMSVVAEGVETEAHAAFLKKHECDLLQGYVYARPMPYEELVEYLNAHKPEHEAAKVPDSREKTLLLLDDEENIIRSLKRVLRRDGYRILSTTSISEAFDLLAENDVQVIISDQRMPEMSGTEFLSQVKAIHPETVRIVLSGYTDLKSVTDAINEGSIYKFLTKPWDDKQIRQHIQQAFLYYGAARG